MHGVGTKVATRYNYIGSYIYTYIHTYNSRYMPYSWHEFCLPSTAGTIFATYVYAVTNKRHYRRKTEGLTTGRTFVVICI